MIPGDQVRYFYNSLETGVGIVTKEPTGNGWVRVFVGRRTNATPIIEAFRTSALEPTGKSFPEHEIFKGAAG